MRQSLSKRTKPAEWFFLSRKGIQVTFDLTEPYLHHIVLAPARTGMSYFPKCLGQIPRAEPMNADSKGGERP